jgi:hypothetical protein
MKRKIEYPEDVTLILEDNNGGDAFEIIDEGHGQYTFQVGECCIWFIRKTGTISEICQFLMNMAVMCQDQNMETLEPRFSEKIND